MAAEIHRELVQTYGENCIDVSNVRGWKKDFENNRVLLEDERCSKRLADSLTVDNIRRVHEVLKVDSHFTHDEIVLHLPPLRCGWSTIHIIIHNVL